MNIFYCPAEAYPQTRDNPREMCEAEVENEGDLCLKHDEPDDDFCHERYLDEKYDREHDPDYYTDFGD